MWPLLIVVLGIIVIICLFKYGLKSDEYDFKNWKKDAKITDVSVKKVGHKGNRRYRTTVTFSDGFKYVTDETERKDYRLLGLYKISLPDNLKKQIIRRAEIEHYMSFMRYQNKHHKNDLKVEENNPPNKEVTKEILKPIEERSWVCPACKKRNMDSLDKCWNCGTSK